MTTVLAPASYGEYVFEPSMQGAGWALTMLSLACIPAVALYQVHDAESLIQHPRFEDHSREIYDLVLDTGRRLGQELLQLVDLKLAVLLEVLLLQGLHLLLAPLPEVRGQLQAVNVATAVSHYQERLLVVEGDVVENSLLLGHNRLKHTGLLLLIYQQELTKPGRRLGYIC